MNSALYRLLADYPLEKLLQNIPTGLFLVDTHKRIVYWNSEAERITGFSSAEAIGRDCSFLDGEPCGRDCGLFSELFPKPVTSITCSFRHKSGHKVYLTKNIDQLKDRNNQIVGGIEAFIEITKFKKQEHLLREAVAERTRELEVEKASLISVLDGMADPVYICDNDFNLIFVNRAMGDILGDRNDLPCHEAIYHKKYICEDCPLDKVLDGQIVRQEKKILEAGRTYEIIHSPHPLRKKPSQKLAVFRDITERIESERRLHQANRELDAFVSTVSHDLRSPLTPLIGFADLLEERYGNQLDEIGKVSLIEIKKTAEKMKDLLEDLLSLSQVGQLKTPEHPVEATTVAHEVLLELADQVLGAQARVTIGTLPSYRMPEPLMSNLFRNLLMNALKYATSHDPRIEVTGYKNLDRIRYQVRDYGPGIDDDEFENVFEPFKRGRSSVKTAGTGIGLATVAKIARVYGGSAWVEKTPGGGATFIVDLPRKTATN